MQTPKELPEIAPSHGPPMVQDKPQANKPLAVQPRPAPKIPRQDFSQPQQKKEFKLPKIERPPRQKIPAPEESDSKVHHDDIREFEEAINNIDIDIVHSDAPEESAPEYEESEDREDRGKKKEKSDYYKPGGMGEGYFSEIEHYLKNKNVHEIVDDIMKKDFLTGMKDYHDTKSEGKPFYLHKHDLEHKLKKKMDFLRKMEEEWHSRRTEIEKKQKQAEEIEQEIDKESQDIKELFRQVKINYWYEQEAPKEHYFELKKGQKLKSINDLRKALSYMTEEEFSHHVTPEKNDFAEWIRDALQNHLIYNKIKDTKTKEELEQALKNPF